MRPWFSVFTPTNDARFLPAAYASLKAQTRADWEWLLLPNGGAQVPPVISADPRVRVLPAFDHEFVGALKRRTCLEARGAVLVELDHDDLLAPEALAAVGEALSDGCGFAYSNAMHCDLEFKPTERYSDRFGWQYRTASYGDHVLDSPVSFAPTPEAVARIWYAPNHVRAFTRALYERVGGYNDGMRVLDDLELMCRMFVETPFAHIDRPLYVYRIHGGNSWLKHCQEIQDNVYRIYDRFIQPMALVHAKRRGLRALDLGARFAAAAGYESVDVKLADVCCDLEQRWPFEDSSVGVVRAFDVFEHLRDPLHTMTELYRVLAPGGMAFLQVPSTDGRGAFQDPTHRSYWNENSWLYYTQARWARYIDTPVRFAAVRSYTTAADPFGVVWTVAHLVSLKDGYRPPGLIAI